jgi:hypothetical protein
MRPEDGPPIEVLWLPDKASSASIVHVRSGFGGSFVASDVTVAAICEPTSLAGSG